MKKGRSDLNAEMRSFEFSQDIVVTPSHNPAELAAERVLTEMNVMDESGPGSGTRESISGSGIEITKEPSETHAHVTTISKSHSAVAPHEQLLDK